MYPLPLSQDHRKKLLEMAKKLFPEYRIEHSAFENTVEVNVTNKWVNFPKKVYHGYDDIEDWSIGWTKIHWFEFIMIFLAPKIQEKLGQHYEGNLNGLLLFNIITHAYHPIPYIYKQFKLIR